MIKYLVLILFSINSYAMSFAHATKIYYNILKANNMHIGQRLVLEQNDDHNAKSGLTRITLYTGMLRFVRNDDEMAMVLGHEIAHWRLHHRRSTPSNEYAADYQGGKYMSRAGYNMCKGAKILARFGDTDSKTHPAGTKRYRRLCK